MIFNNAVVLIAGGTGSFGNFMVAKLLEHNLRELRILSRDEKKQYDMKKHYGSDERLRFFIGSIRDFECVNQVMAGVDIVLQAAALKQVPNCEMNPMEAIKTNVIGVDNVIRAAIAHQTSLFITVSTDKAVKPVNVMGMTKALQERLVINANYLPDNSATRFLCVRYGNVMSSRGSAIPFFRELIARDEVITITDVHMTRFLLTFGDAIDLVSFATENAQGGEIFVKKAPSVRIVDLARILCEQAGKPFSYREIGKYPGEKIHEILISEEELNRTIDRGDYFNIAPWWETAHYKHVVAEYSSADHVASDDVIKQLLDKSDDEFERVAIRNGYFAKI